eukprot:138316-Rhodomonas_salina.3
MPHREQPGLSNAYPGCHTAIYCHPPMKSRSPFLLPLKQVPRQTLPCSAAPHSHPFRVYQRSRARPVLPI